MLKYIYLYKFVINFTRPNDILKSCITVYTNTTYT